MHNCGLLGAVGGPHTLRPHQVLCGRPFVSVTLAPAATSTTAAHVARTHTSTTAEPQAEVQQIAAAPVEDAGQAAAAAAPAKRRRRSTAAAGADASAAEAQPSSEPAKTPAAAAKPKKQSVRSSKPPKIQQLFQSPPSTTTAAAALVVAPRPTTRRVSPQQPALLPAGAEVEPSKVLAASKAAAAAAKAQAQLQRVDPQVAAGFQAYQQTFQAFTGAATGTPSFTDTTDDAAAGDATAAAPAKPAAAKVAAAAAAARAKAKAGPRAAAAAAAAPAGGGDKEQQQQQPDGGSSQGRRGSSAHSKRDFLELFGMSMQQEQQQQLQAVRLSRDAPPAAIPEAARKATQQLANLVSAQQQQQQLQRLQRLKQQQQQDMPVGEGLSPLGVAGQEQQQQQQQQQGGTVIYTPVPAKSVADSEEQRQPLRLMSLRQQQALREEARRAAVARLREKSVREYEATVQAMLDWQPSSSDNSSRFYIPGAPTHFPVVVQRQWQEAGHGSASTAAGTTLNSSSSSTVGGTEEQSGAAASGAAAAAIQQQQPSDESSQPSPPVRALTPTEQQTLHEISTIMQQQLGVPLPERALRGERSLLLASLAPAAVKERLAAWVACCYRDYVIQLMTKEPSLLGHEPGVLLNTLQAISSEMMLSEQESVALSLKQPALIGLDQQELRARLDALARSVGCDRQGAARLVAFSSTLAMLKPEYIKERMAALSSLLPEAASKMSKQVVRNPFLLVKSPRALARSILQMSDRLELSSWATCRLVAGMPQLINTNFDTVRNRLDRLQQVTSPVRRWRRDLQALSPPALARCLTASDATIERLQQLRDIGAANSPKLPPINKILTMPTHWWERVYAETAASRELAAENLAAAAAEAAEAADALLGASGAAAGAAGAVVTGGADGSSSSSGEGVGGVQDAARAAARAALAKLRSSAAATTAGGTQAAVPPGSTMRGTVHSTDEHDEGVAGVRGRVGWGCCCWVEGQPGRGSFGHRCRPGGTVAWAHSGSSGGAGCGQAAAGREGGRC